MRAYVFHTRCLWITTSSHLADFVVAQTEPQFSRTGSRNCMQVFASPWEYGNHSSEKGASIALSIHDSQTPHYTRRICDCTTRLALVSIASCSYGGHSCDMDIKHITSTRVSTHKGFVLMINLFGACRHVLLWQACTYATGSARVRRVQRLSHSSLSGNESLSIKCLTEGFWIKSNIAKTP